MPAAKPTKAAIQRAIEATKAAGLVPTAVCVSTDGTFRIETVAKESVDTGPSDPKVLKPKKWATTR